jgi:hypothetical protein
MSIHDYNNSRIRFSEEEQEYMFSENLAVRLIGFLQINQKARDIIKKRIEIIEKNNDSMLKKVIPDLKHGDEVLEGGQERFMRDGLKGMEASLKRSKRGDRPGFGLSRGFGEFLHCYQKDGKLDPWAEEIDNAVRKIEHYYNNM